MTKSRSAYVGLAAALVAGAWHERRRVPRRTFASVGIGGVVVVGLLVGAGLAAGRLDRAVLTQSTMSLRYRWEYWVGAWRVITEKPYRVFWGGHGPGNFTALYLRHKLPQSSEEIFDPHNLFLEVWSTAGLPALVALVSALGLAFWNLLLRPSSPGQEPATEGEPLVPKPAAESGAPPRSARWLLIAAGGGWLVAVLLGHLNPFEGDLLERWLILGAAWLGACVVSVPLWRRVAIPSWAFGAAALSVVVNLLAAGGIGLPAVALMLWLMIALGLNVSEDRAPGRLRVAGGRVTGFGLALVWASLIGTFAGAIAPFWKAEAAMAEAETALQARPPQFEKAEAAYQRAVDADHGLPRPWLGLAFEKYEEWRFRGARIDDLRWKSIPFSLAEAVTPPRNPYSWNLHHERAQVMRQLLKELGPNLKPKELITYQGNIVEAFRRASRLYPTNATLHAELAESSAEIGKFDDALKEAREALKYDGLTPHQDKKLTPRLRKRLEDALPKWEKSAQGMNLPSAPPKS